MLPASPAHRIEQLDLAAPSEGDMHRLKQCTVWHLKQCTVSENSGAVLRISRCRQPYSHQLSRSSPVRVSEPELPGERGRQGQAGLHADPGTNTERANPGPALQLGRQQPVPWASHVGQGTEQLVICAIIWW